jgi:hypothetical protein
MNSFHKILVVSSLLFFICLQQYESKKELVSFSQTEKKTSFNQRKVTNFYLIQPSSITIPAIEISSKSSLFDWNSILTSSLLIVNNRNTTAVKAFIQKSIDCIATVSFLLYPVHYFW